MRDAVAFVLCLLASGLQGQIRKPSADDLFNEAMKAAQAEDYPKAELWLREMRLSYPQDQRAGTALINVLESANKLGEALRVGRELQVQYKASPAFHMGVGRVLLKLDRVSEALTEFQTALRSAGDAWTKEQAYVLIGDAQRASGNLDAAIASYRQAKDVSGRPQFQLAFSLGERGDVDGEIREYRALLASEVLDELRGQRDDVIPERLLQRAYAVAVIPGVIKGAFIVGGRFGRGVVMARDEQGRFSNPTEAKKTRTRFFYACIQNQGLGLHAVQVLAIAKIFLD